MKNIGLICNFRYTRFVRRLLYIFYLCLTLPSLLKKSLKRKNAVFLAKISWLLTKTSSSTTRFPLLLMERSFRFRRRHCVQRNDRRGGSRFVMNENSTRESVAPLGLSSFQIIMLMCHFLFLAATTGSLINIIRLTTGWNLISRKTFSHNSKHSPIKLPDFIYSNRTL